MGKLNPAQKRAINSVIKKELEKTTEEFIYYKDIYKPLLAKLKGKQKFPFKTIASLTKYFAMLEDQDELNEFPYLYRESEASLWRFYKIEHRSLRNLELIDEWISEKDDELIAGGLIHVSQEVIPDRRDIDNEILKLDELIPVDVTDDDYFGDYELYLRKLLKDDSFRNKDALNRLIQLFELSRLDRFFKLNLGEEEYSFENRRMIVEGLLRDRLDLIQAVERKGDILFDPDRVFIVEDVPSYLTAIKEATERSQEKEVFFRGQGKYFWNDVPGLFRNGDAPKQEHRLFKEVILKNPEEFINHHTTFEKLTKMQHYELPTRLMDITSNPLVAIYFAVSNAEHDNTPSEVILYGCETEKIKYFDSDHVSVLANLAQRPKKYEFLDEVLTMVEKYEDEGYTTEEAEKFGVTKFNQEAEVGYLHHTIKGEKPYFLEIINPRHINASVIVKSKLDNERIKKQDGAFIIVGIDRHDPNKPAPINFYLRSKKGDRLRIILADKNEAGENVAELIRKELDTLSYNRGTLFPEIMNSAQYIKNKYLG